MAALGKNPELLRQDKLGSSTWELAGAWLMQARLTKAEFDAALDFFAIRDRGKDKVDLPA